MNIVQITPGAGGMYCGNCFRDNALVGELRRLGHQVTMVPLYLPMTLEDADQSLGTPIFFSGINVYLEQKLPLFSRAPGWLRSLLASPALLKWAAGSAAKTKASDLGDISLSMLRGELGRQRKDLEELVDWLENHEKPDVVFLSNALLVGSARLIKQRLKIPVVCMLQGEDSFLDALPDSHRELTWNTLAERAQEVDVFVAPSHYFAEKMGQRLGLPKNRIHVVHNGIDPTAFDPVLIPPSQPTIGFFARMCPEKGLEMLVEAFVIVATRNKVAGVRLKIGGGLGPSDRDFVGRLRGRLEETGLTDRVEWHPNLDKTEKKLFFESLSVFSVPALYGEAFGLYLLEAWAAGVPVVQPRHASFPELVEASQAGILVEQGHAEALADGLTALLSNEPRRLQYSQAARLAATTQFHLSQMAGNLLKTLPNLNSTACEMG